MAAKKRAKFTVKERAETHAKMDRNMLLAYIVVNLENIYKEVQRVNK